MLTRDLISNTIPYLLKSDTVYHALQLMNDYHVVHLPDTAWANYCDIAKVTPFVQKVNGE